MDALAYILLAVLTRGSVSDLNLGAQLEKNLGGILGPGGHIEVQVQARPGRHAVSGQLRQIRVRLHRVDAARLPLQRFIPQPRERVLKGRVDRFVLEATDARLQALSLTRLRMTAEDLRFDLLHALRERDLRITDVAATQIEAILTSRDLEAYIQAQRPSLQDPHLELSPEGLRLTAQVDLLGLFAGSLELTARLSLVPPKEIHLLEPQLRLNNLPVPAAISQTFLGTVNPLLHLDRLTALPLPILLDELEIQSGRLVLRGHLEMAEERNLHSVPW